MTAGEGGARPFTVFLIAGEESGDALGARLMQALTARAGEPVRFIGIGGARMAAAGQLPTSLSPTEELALHGLSAVVANIPNILRRIRGAAAAITALVPDVVVLIDTPDFNLRVARKVRQKRPAIPIVHYVSPTVWVWRPGRARRMRPIVDKLLAILPFEPKVHEELGGPPCVYVGHPAIENLATLRPKPGERPPLTPGKKSTLLVLPGSRRSEVGQLTDVFGEAVARVVERSGTLEVLVPAVPSLAEEIKARVAAWKVQATIVEGEAAKFAAFRRAHAALAASGTVTLELALSGVPMAVAYRIDWLAKLLKPIIYRQARPPVWSIVLPNLVLGELAIPEFVDKKASPEALAGALLPLLQDSPERRRQTDAFARLDGLMSVAPDTPSIRAADAVLATVREKRERPA